MTQPDIERLSALFNEFAEAARQGSSLLYEYLAHAIADDRQLLALAAHSPAEQPVALMLFAAVHYLLLNGTEHALADFYADLTSTPRPAADAYPHFVEYCAKQRAAIIELLGTGKVQTNEVRRCALLLPAIALVAERGGAKPLSMVEIGPSAGLTMLWNRYSYEYSDGQRLSQPDAPFVLTCEVKGKIAPPIPSVYPQVAYQVGVELNPIDVHDDDAIRWLKALIWPEHLERRERLQLAIELTRQETPHIISGDALDLLPQVLGDVPEDTTLCVYHSFAVYQFSQPMRDRLERLLAEHAQSRDVHHIAVEWYSGAEGPTIELAHYSRSARREQVLANCQPHGQWIEWLAETED